MASLPVRLGEQGVASVSLSFGEGGGASLPVSLAEGVYFIIIGCEKLICSGFVFVFFVFFKISFLL